jgi:hypothetical protein
MKICLLVFLVWCINYVTSLQPPACRRNFQNSKLSCKYEIDDILDVFDDEVIAYDKERSFEDDFFDEAERDADRNSYPKGTPEGFYVTKMYSVPSDGFGNLVASSGDEEGARRIAQELVDRLDICGTNITLSVALTLLDPEEFPSLSKSRKSCRSVRLLRTIGNIKPRDLTIRLH